MAKIFRYSIKGSNFTTIEEEMKIIEEYMNIMEIRFMGKFTTEINIDKDLYPVQTIKMIIQVHSF
jgi:two-component system, sensor histidine kinase YesM